jgi:hypothetical protein
MEQKLQRKSVIPFAVNSNANHGNVSRAPKRAALYVRIYQASRFRAGDRIGYEQNPAVQEQPLGDLIAHRGWLLHKVYADRFSGGAPIAPNPFGVSQ